MKFLLKLIILIFIFSINNSYANELVGPNIFGLQLGMQFNQALEIANNKTENNCKQNQTYPEEFICSKPHSGGIDISNTNGVLSKYTISLDFFNYNNSMDKRTFLKQFIEYYKIPELDYVQDTGDGHYVYKNSNEGYEINITFIIYGYVTVNYIEKINDLNFE